MRVLIILFLCLLVPAAIAIPDYWTVVADDGKAADVVNAANFAASMKASAAVTFTGKTDSQAKAAQQNPDGRLSVRFAGTSASIATSDDIDDFVVDTAIAYLEQQGFAVSVVDDDQDSPSTQGDEDEPSQEERSVEAVTPPTAPAVAPPGSVGGPSEDDAQEPLDEAVGDEPGFLSRVWRWFAGIFS